MVTRDSLPAELLEDVKLSCDVTWNDEATDTKYRGFITNGMVYINDKYGEEADYTVDGYPRMLLMEYVRYARDSALDVFENNYQSLILAMQNNKAVSRYVESTQQNAE